jgi:hypothetical protein
MRCAATRVRTEALYDTLFTTSDDEPGQLLSADCRAHALCR